MRSGPAGGQRRHWLRRTQVAGRRVLGGNRTEALRGPPLRPQYPRTLRVTGQRQEWPGLGLGSLLPWGAPCCVTGLCSRHAPHATHCGLPSEAAPLPHFADDKTESPEVKWLAQVTRITWPGELERARPVTCRFPGSLPWNLPARLPSPGLSWAQGQVGLAGPTEGRSPPRPRRVQRSELSRHPWGPCRGAERKQLLLCLLQNQALD